MGSQNELNAAGYAQMIDSITRLNKPGIALLNAPQTSGGLLVSCAADTVDAVLAIFHQQGFSQATVNGEVTQGPVGLTVRWPLQTITGSVSSRMPNRP